MLSSPSRTCNIPFSLRSPSDLSIRGGQLRLLCSKDRFVNIYDDDGDDDDDGGGDDNDDGDNDDEYKRGSTAPAMFQRQV